MGLWYFTRAGKLIKNQEASVCTTLTTAVRSISLLDQGTNENQIGII